MAETQVVIRVERMLWRQFRAGCILRDSAPTQEIARFISQQIDEWKQEEAARREQEL